MVVILKFCEMKTIEFVPSHNGAVVTVRLNIPQKRNAISLQMFRDLIRFLKEAEKNPKLTIIVLTGRLTKRIDYWLNIRRSRCDFFKC